MAFDIYGEYLTPGYCEVHPWVAEEYPCSLCDFDRMKREKQRDEERKFAMEEQEREYSQYVYGNGEGI